MAKKIMILSHGFFGTELKKSVEMIMGEQPQIVALPLLEEDGLESYVTKVRAVLADTTDDEWLLVCDLFGGTPANVAMSFLKRPVEHVITGINMPVIIELIAQLESNSSWQEILINLAELQQTSIQFLPSKN